MTTFRGFGPGKGKWKTLVIRDGEVLEDPAPAAPKARTPKVHTRFTAHMNHSLTAEAAKRHGLERDEESKGTWIPSEKKLNEYLATEKGHGRDVFWREH